MPVDAVEATPNVVPKYQDMFGMDGPWANAADEPPRHAAMSSAPARVRNMRAPVLNAGYQITIGIAGKASQPGTRRPAGGACNVQQAIDA